MPKCNGTKFLPHNSISLTFWTIFFIENISYPFIIFPVIRTWGTKYLKLKQGKYQDFWISVVHISSNKSTHHQIYTLEKNPEAGGQKNLHYACYYYWRKIWHLEFLINGRQKLQNKGKNTSDARNIRILM